MISIEFWDVFSKYYLLGVVGIISALAIFLKKFDYPGASSSAESQRKKYAATFDGHEQIVDGLLWVTNESTLVVTEELNTSNNLGIRLFEHIGITKGGRWFCLNVDVKYGRIIRRELTPLPVSVAARCLERHREAYEEHFGPSGVA